MFSFFDLIKISGREDTSIKVSEPRESQLETNLVRDSSSPFFSFFLQQIGTILANILAQNANKLLNQNITHTKNSYNEVFDHYSSISKVVTVDTTEQLHPPKIVHIF